MKKYTCALILIGFICITAAAADTNRRDRITFSLDRSTSKSVLTLNLPADLKVHHFELSDPPRLVLDIFGLLSKRNRSFPLSNDALIEKIRLGSHPERCRVVLDLRAPTKYEIRAEKGKVSVALTSKSEILNVFSTESEPIRMIARVELLHTPLRFETVPPPLLAHFDAPQFASPALLDRVILKTVDTPALLHASFGSLPSLANIPNSVTEPESDLVNANQPLFPSTALSTALAFQEELPELIFSPTRLSIFSLANKQSFTAITFNETAGDASVELIFLHSPNFEFAKSGSDLYTLRVKESLLAGEHLLLPQFPPQNFSGLLFVNPMKTDKGLEITFGVEPGFRLSAYAQGSSILISSRPSS